MADDEQLRARIEAQVAARRAAERAGAERDVVAGAAGSPEPVVPRANRPGATDVAADVRRDRFAALHAAATAQAAAAAARADGAPSQNGANTSGRPAGGEQPAVADTAGAAVTDTGRGRRAMRWLFAREPEPTPEPTPTPEPVPQPTPEPMPQPTPEPMPQPTPEPMPQPTPEPMPQPPADAEPATAQPTAPRPRPRPAPPARPRSPQPRPVAGVGGDSTASSEPAAGDTAPPAGAASPAGTASPADTAPPSESSSSGDTRRRAVTRRLLRIGVLLVIAVGAIVLLRTFVVSPYYIPSGSMEPTLHGCHGCNDDRVLVDKISYRFHDPHRTDIVVFNRPPRAEIPDKVLIKRVIGLPGDHIAVRGGRVWLDGKRLREPYVHSGCRTQPLTGRSQWTVPRGDVFVMGDNRCSSLDSRQFGPIAESSIIGRAFVIVWPLGQIGLL